MKYIEKIEKKNAILLAREGILNIVSCIVLKKIIFQGGEGSGNPQPSFYIRLRFFILDKNKTKTERNSLEPNAL